MASGMNPRVVFVAREVDILSYISTVFTADVTEGKVVGFESERVVGHCRRYKFDRKQTETGMWPPVHHVKGRTTLCLDLIVRAALLSSMPLKVMTIRR